MHEVEDVDGISDDEDEDGRRVRRRRVGPDDGGQADQPMHEGTRGPERVLPTPATPGEAAPQVEVQEDGEAVPPAPEVHPVIRPPRVRPLLKPVEATRAQRELHELTHYPYAAWCRHCVRCKSANAPHRSLRWHAQGDQVAVVSGDFAFLGQRDQEGTTTVFVLRDRISKMTFAHVLQGKSTSREIYSDYVVGTVCRDLDSLPYGGHVGTSGARQGQA